MIKLKKSQHKKYEPMFQHFKVFTNFVEYVLIDVDYDMYVDNLENPKIGLIHSKPFYVIAGDASSDNVEDLLSIIESRGWLVPETNEWNDPIEKYLKGVQGYERTLFDSSKLDIEVIKSYKRELPENLRIVPIEEKHIKVGLIEGDVTSRFFVKRDFMNHGFGFALVDENETVHGFSLTNFPYSGNEIELYFRIGLEDYTLYRDKGIATILAAYLIEECLKRNITPTWDAAHEVSAHIAKKLGYIPIHTWKMYRAK